MKLPTLLLLFIALASGAALAQADAGKNPAPPFSITIRAIPSTMIQVGQKQKLWMAIVITNLSDHPMDAPSTWMGASDTVYGFDIRDSTGKQIPWVAPPTVGFIDGLESDILQPGQSKSEEVNISDYYNMSKPGSYAVHAMRAVFVKNPQGNRAPIMNLTQGEIKSNVITITVVAAKPETSQ